MTEPLPDPWSNRDLPVLREVVRQLTAGDRAPMPSQIANALGLSVEGVTLGAINLGRGGLVHFSSSFGAQVSFFEDVSAEALRLAGVWPKPETALDRMIAALEQLQDDGDTEDDRTRARKILDGLCGASRQVAIGVATAAITGQMPG